MSLLVMSRALTITASTPDFGEAREALAIECSQAIEIGFNARYLAEGLAAINDDTVAMEFKEPLSAAVLRPAEGNDYICLIMPMRVE